MSARNSVRHRRIAPCSSLLAAGKRASRRFAAPFSQAARRSPVAHRRIACRSARPRASAGSACAQCPSRRNTRSASITAIASHGSASASARAAASANASPNPTRTKPATSSTPSRAARDAATSARSAVRPTGVAGCLSAAAKFGNATASAASIAPGVSPVAASAHRSTAGRASVRSSRRNPAATSTQYHPCSTGSPVSVWANCRSSTRAASGVPSSVSARTCTANPRPGRSSSSTRSARPAASSSRNRALVDSHADSPSSPPAWRWRCWRSTAATARGTARRGSSHRRGRGRRYASHSSPTAATRMYTP